MVLQVWQPYAEQERLDPFRARRPQAPRSPHRPAGRPGPLALGDPDTVRAVLTAAGLAEPQLVGVADVAAAETLARTIVGGTLDADARAGALAGLREAMAAHLGPDGVTYRSAAWLVVARGPATP